MTLQLLPEICLDLYITTNSGCLALSTTLFLALWMQQEWGFLFSTQKQLCVERNFMSPLLNYRSFSSGWLFPGKRRSAEERGAGVRAQRGEVHLLEVGRRRLLQHAHCPAWVRNRSSGSLRVQSRWKNNFSSLISVANCKNRQTCFWFQWQSSLDWLPIILQCLVSYIFYSLITSG